MRVLVGLARMPNETKWWKPEDFGHCAARTDAPALAVSEKLMGSACGC